MSTKLVEYLSTTRLGERGTMTLPKEYRDLLKLKTGAPMTVLRIGDGLILMPEQTRFEELCDTISSKLEHAGISEAALQATLPEVRQRLTARRYPGLFTSDSAERVRSKQASRPRKKR